eukprot:g44416.t1
MEFFRVFWDVPGGDYTWVLGEYLMAGQLPFSWCRAVMVLLSKKGDLRFLKHWCPVSLLDTDYKIFARVLASHLASVLLHVIHPDQSYVVLGRMIHENIHPEKAFDRVDHEYLLGTLRAFRFGMQFVILIQLCMQMHCLVKVNRSLMTPSLWERSPVLVINQLVAFVLCPTLLIFGHPVWRGRAGQRISLVGLLLGLAKLVINKRQQELQMLESESTRCGAGGTQQ